MKRGSKGVKDLKPSLWVSQAFFCAPGERSGWWGPWAPPPNSMAADTEEAQCPSVEGSNLRLFSAAEPGGGMGVPGTGCPGWGFSQLLSSESQIKHFPPQWSTGIVIVPTLTLHKEELSAPPPHPRPVLRRKLNEWYTLSMSGTEEPLRVTDLGGRWLWELSCTVSMAAASMGPCKSTKESCTETWDCLHIYIYIYKNYPWENLLPPR